MSKFAFSLRPEVIVPYDKRARQGLGAMFGRRLPDHDYPAYLAAFHRFADAFSAHLDETGVTRRVGDARVLRATRELAEHFRMGP